MNEDKKHFKVEQKLRINQEINNETYKVCCTI